VVGGRKDVAEARQPNPYDGLNERSQDNLYAHKPKKLQEGKTKFKEPWTEEAEKRDQLAEALGEAMSTVAMSLAYPRERARRPWSPGNPT
jgi:epoxyqueuosine reductase QueG